MKIKGMSIRIRIEGEDGLELNKEFRFASEIGKYKDYYEDHCQSPPNKLGGLS